MKPITLLQKAGYRVRKWLAYRRWRAAGMHIGAGSSINAWTCFMDPDRVRIGAFCSISNATFVTHRGGDTVQLALGRDPATLTKPEDYRIEVLSFVEIGVGAIIIGPCRIEPGAVVAAGAVVRARRVPEGEVWAGNPARRIGRNRAFDDRPRMQDLVGRAFVAHSPTLAANITKENPLYARLSGLDG